ncbi:Xylose operon regulatory protein [Rubripirellula obstinata]|uniref:Xylose operon regulatory protein n=1 Tax=Rubripirellula obstinata TaxID=406547 RepID=A0A5B1CKS4_9BACT|nr:AraC family transcriptional regulator [Rubripirellula obstinata]KAA1259924.1 Xylose operon regulatory protein [Rubripirellula obstinata]
MQAPFDFHHYLPINDADLLSGLYLIGGGRRRIVSGATYPPVEHPGVYQFQWSQGRELPEYQIILLSDGGGEFESKPTGTMKWNDAALVILFPGVWHRYKPKPKQGWTERWISIHGQDVPTIFDEGGLSPEHAVIPLSNVEWCEQTFDTVLQRIASEPTGQSAALRIGAMQVMAVTLDHVPAKSNLPPDEPLSRVKDSVLNQVSDELVKDAVSLIWTQSHRRMTVDHLVSQLPCTRRTLERRFSTELGHTILDEINRCRLTRAKMMLKQTTLPIKSIAYMSGFGDQERLRVLLHQDEHCSPSEYRERSHTQEST